LQVGDAAARVAAGVVVDREVVGVLEAGVAGAELVGVSAMAHSKRSAAAAATSVGEQEASRNLRSHAVNGAADTVGMADAAEVRTADVAEASTTDAAELSIHAAAACEMAEVIVGTVHDVAPEA